MATHTLLVMWTAERIDGIRFDGESIHVSPLASNADIERIKRDIRDLYRHEHIESVVFRNVTVITSGEI